MENPLMRYHDWTDMQTCVRRPGLVFGVCRWTADRLGIAAIWVRLAAIVAAWWTSWWAMLAIYLAAAIALGRTRCVSSHTRGSASRADDDVRHWRHETTAGFWSRMAELERRLDSAEYRFRRSRA